MDESKIKDEVWQTIQTMNRLWTVDGKEEKIWSAKKKARLMVSHKGH